MIGTLNLTETRTEQKWVLMRQGGYSLECQRFWLRPLRPLRVRLLRIGRAAHD